MSIIFPTLLSHSFCPETPQTLILKATLVPPPTSFLYLRNSCQNLPTYSSPLSTTTCNSFTSRCILILFKASQEDRTGTSNNDNDNKQRDEWTRLQFVSWFEKFQLAALYLAVFAAAYTSYTFLSSFPLFCLQQFTSGCLIPSKQN